MSAYLLTWNTTQSPTQNDGSQDSLLHCQVGDEIRWPCQSKQPTSGDTVYVTRLGDDPQGIVAQGVVTQSALVGTNENDEANSSTYIQFQVQSIRKTAAEGMLPLLLLNAALPEQEWHPQYSGIVIEADHASTLASLWRDGANTHALIQFMRWDQQHNFNQQWYHQYQEVCQLAAEIKGGKAITDDDVNRLWRMKANGVASAGKGMIPNEEFNTNIELLRQLTMEIIQAPTVETYQHVFDIWKVDGTFKRFRQVVINRVFSAADPERYTSIANGSCLPSLCRCLQAPFQIDVQSTGHWLHDNQNLLQAVNPLIPPEWDVFTRNILLWNLYEWSVEIPRQVTHAMNHVNEDDAEYQTTPASQNEKPKRTQRPRNIIFYGPPGTGKTYTLQALQKQYTSTPAHSDNSLWLQEKIAPLTWMQVLVLSLLDLGRQAKVTDIVNNKYFQTKATINRCEGKLGPIAWGCLQKFTVPDSATVNYKTHGEPAVFDKTADSVWILLDDKLELVDDLVQLYAELERGPQSRMRVKRYSTLTFHQSYGYEEFIEGLKAATDDEGNVHYSLEAGAFLTLCRRAEQDPEHQYAIFIDEINRGNISKIFGELISLIEIDKRAQGKHPMAINLAYSKQLFSVPSNVDIIGTMNTADRSLALMDTALRRRFEFIEMMPDPALFSGSLGITCSNDVTINLQQLLSTLNARIAALYDREHTLGHAFFFPAYHAAQSGDYAQAFQALKAAFQTKILPLLQEYFYDDWSKIRLVLGDNQKPEALQFIHQQSVDYLALFGRHYQADDVTSEQQYVLMDNAAAVWDNALAYLAIYAPQEANQRSQQQVPGAPDQADAE
ncbi:AAA family ATPase [Edwardsiella anguillarum]|uniref:AAA family ATPase n=1 Tax=Edwardsiella anguillarum TaxID=1821960 RepID=UPI0024B715AA|nr:AAA family ATPase [Edwardsiella anguillarum]WHQ15511.1 AAA family ATPase [Edwardsiella anguillarum]